MEQKNLKEKNKQIKKVMLYFLTSLGLSALLFFFALMWQDRNDLLGIVNAFYFSSFIFLGFSFIVFAANKNVFSPIIYGTKTFFLMFAGRKPKKSYYEYTKEIDEAPLPKMLIYFPIYSAIPNLIVSITLHIIYNSSL